MIARCETSRAATTNSKRDWCQCCLAVEQGSRLTRTVDVNLRTWHAAAAQEQPLQVLAVKAAHAADGVLQTQEAQVAARQDLNDVLDPVLVLLVMNRVQPAR